MTDLGVVCAPIQARTWSAAAAAAAAFNVSVAFRLLTQALGISGVDEPASPPGGQHENQGKIRMSGAPDKLTQLFCALVLR